MHGEAGTSNIPTHEFDMEDPRLRAAEGYIMNQGARQRGEAAFLDPNTDTNRILDFVNGLPPKERQVALIDIRSEKGIAALDKRYPDANIQVMYNSGTKPNSQPTNRVATPEERANPDAEALRRELRIETPNNPSGINLSRVSLTLTEET